MADIEGVCMNEIMYRNILETFRHVATEVRDEIRSATLAAFNDAIENIRWNREHADRWDLSCK